MIGLEPVTLGIIAVVIVLVLLGGVAVSLIVIRRKYSLNWYQKTSLEDSKLIGCKNVSTGSLRVVKQQISSRKISRVSSSSDDESTEDSSALLKDETDDDETYRQRHGLFDKLSKHVGFIQPPVSQQMGEKYEELRCTSICDSTVSDPRVVHSKMGGEESRHIKPILKTQKSDLGLQGGNRRFSAPVIYGKAAAGFRRAISVPVMQTLPEASELSHAKLTSTRSAPYSTPIAETDEKSFTLPLTSTEETHSASAMARLARRRTSMQDSIDTTAFDPSLYKGLERAPTIKEEASIDINEPIGIIFLTVCLTTDTNLLKVTIHKADLTGFPSCHLHLRSPYFTVFVSGSNSPVRQTRHADDEQSPIFEESFLFEIEDGLPGKQLMCSLYDYDQFIKTEKVGEMQLRLHTLPQDEPLYIEKHIDRCPVETHDHEENYMGELLFSLKCTKSKENLTLTLFIAKAKDLHIEDELAVLGLMVKATVLERGKKYKKKRTVDNVKVSTSPMFNQEIVLSLPQPLNLADMSVMVDLCKVKLSSSEVIGRVCISSEGDKREVEHWREVQESKNSDGKTLEWWHQLKKVEKGS